MIFPLLARHSICSHWRGAPRVCHRIGRVRSSDRGSQSQPPGHRASTQECQHRVMSSVAQDYFQTAEAGSSAPANQHYSFRLSRFFEADTIPYQGGVASELDTTRETALDTALAEIPSLEQQIGQEEVHSDLLGQNPASIRAAWISRRSHYLRRYRQVCRLNCSNAGLTFWKLHKTWRPNTQQGGVRRSALTASGGLESNAPSQIVFLPALMWTATAGATAPLFHRRQAAGKFERGQSPTAARTSHTKALPRKQVEKKNQTTHNSIPRSREQVADPGSTSQSRTGRAASG